MKAALPEPRHEDAAQRGLGKACTPQPAHERGKGKEGTGRVPSLLAGSFQPPRPSAGGTDMETAKVLGWPTRREMLCWEVTAAESLTQHQNQIIEQVIASGYREPASKHTNISTDTCIYTYRTRTCISERLQTAGTEAGRMRPEHWGVRSPEQPCGAGRTTQPPTWGGGRGVFLQSQPQQSPHRAVRLCRQCVLQEASSLCLQPSCSEGCHVEEAGCWGSASRTEDHLPLCPPCEQANPFSSSD